MAREPKTSLALPKIDTEEKSLDLRLRLKGKAAVDLTEYQAAYAEANGAIELEILAATSWRRSSRRTKASRPGGAAAPPAPRARPPEAGRRASSPVPPPLLVRGGSPPTVTSADVAARSPRLSLTRSNHAAESGDELAVFRLVAGSISKVRGPPWVGVA